MRKSLLITFLLALITLVSVDQTRANGPVEMVGCVVSVNGAEVEIMDNGGEGVFVGRAANVNILVGDEVTFIGIVTPTGLQIAIKVIKDDKN